ncbi:MAG: hypothetical protein Q9227_008005 [Pyrenula ochraceoflavens]
MAVKPRRSRAVVVGSGVGGVAIAARLAYAGFDVRVLEKNSYAGGRCSTLKRNGYTFDRGPSILLVQDVYRGIFSDLNTSLEGEGLELLKCKPNYHVFFPDGDRFEMSTDTTTMAAQIEQREGRKGFEGYLNFLLEAQKHYDLSFIHILNKSFMSYWSLFRPSWIIATPSLHPFESMYSRVSRHLKSDRLRQAFSFASLYVGTSPFRAVGTYSLLPYLELTQGIFYPKGGFENFISSLTRLGQRFNAKYRFNASVKQINVSPEGRATGVTLESGEEIAADVVVINADLIYAYHNLLPPSNADKALNKRRIGSSMLSFYWSLGKKIPELGPHNMFMGDDLRKAMADMESNDTLVHNVFYVHVPSRVDPSAAPAGKDGVVVHIPISSMVLKSNAQGIAEERYSIDRYRDLISASRENVLTRLSINTGHTVEWLRANIIEESIHTPETWESEYNLFRGSTFGISHDLWNLICFRPKPRHAKIKNLYFVGANTQPGSGVPLCLAGAKIVSEMILEAFQMRVPWRHWASRRVKEESSGKTPGVLRLKMARSVISLMNIILIALATVVGLVYLAMQARDKPAAQSRMAAWEQKQWLTGHRVGHVLGQALRSFKV